MVLELAGGDYWLREGGYSEDYKLSRLEWHWGRDDSMGAEHSIDNKGGPAEVNSPNCELWCNPLYKGVAISN